MIAIRPISERHEGPNRYFFEFEVYDDGRCAHRDVRKVRPEMWMGYRHREAAYCKDCGVATGWVPNADLSWQLLLEREVEKQA